MTTSNIIRQFNGLKWHVPNLKLMAPGKRRGDLNANSGMAKENIPSRVCIQQHLR